MLLFLFLRVPLRLTTTQERRDEAALLLLRVRLLLLLLLLLLKREHEEEEVEAAGKATAAVVVAGVVVVARIGLVFGDGIAALSKAFTPIADEDVIENAMTVVDKVFTERKCGAARRERESLSARSRASRVASFFSLVLIGGGKSLPSIDFLMSNSRLPSDSFCAFVLGSREG